jgi:hypothetical protein
MGARNGWASFTQAAPGFCGKAYHRTLCKGNRNTTKSLIFSLLAEQKENCSGTGAEY